MIFGELNDKSKSWTIFQRPFSFCPGLDSLFGVVMDFQFLGPDTVV